MGRSSLSRAPQTGPTSPIQAIPTRRPLSSRRGSERGSGPQLQCANSGMGGDRPVPCRAPAKDRMPSTRQTARASPSGGLPGRPVQGRSRPHLSCRSAVRWLLPKQPATSLSEGRRHHGAPLARSRSSHRRGRALHVGQPRQARARGGAALATSRRAGRRGVGPSAWTHWPCRRAPSRDPCPKK